MLAYNASMDSTDDYTQLSKTTLNEAVTRLVSFILDKYQWAFLRAPTHEDLQRIMARNAECGTPG